MLFRSFSLVEVLVSVSILSVAMLGLALSIPVAIQANHRNRVDAEATLRAQREIEQMIAQPLTATSFTDADGNTVSLAAGGCLIANGKIDFTQAAVAGYWLTATGIDGVRYELRWNVQSLADGGKQYTIGARRIGTQRFLLPPVNLSTRQGK